MYSSSELSRMQIRTAVSDTDLPSRGTGSFYHNLSLRLLINELKNVGFNEEYWKYLLETLELGTPWNGGGGGRWSIKGKEFYAQQSHFFCKTVEIPLKCCMCNFVCLFGWLYWSLYGNILLFQDYSQENNKKKCFFCLPNYCLLLC